MTVSQIVGLPVPSSPAMLSMHCLPASMVTALGHHIYVPWGRRARYVWWLIWIVNLVGLRDVYDEVTSRCAYEAVSRGDWPGRQAN